MNIHYYLVRNKIDISVNIPFKDIFERRRIKISRADASIINRSF